MRESIFSTAHTETLLSDLRRANTEAAKKERFLQYLAVIFAGDNRAQQLISAISLGAEKIIANIPRGPTSGRGRADTQTDTIIVEWEKDLTKTGDHARDQLKEYLEGNWRSGQAYRFVLVATDGIRWRVYAPDWSNIQFGKLTFGSNFELREVRTFELSRERLDDFPFFLDEVLFASQLKIATLENIQTDFGDTSTAFINSIVTLRACSADLETQSELKVALEQWRRFLSIAYGKFDDSPNMFLVHTYLSVFAKFLAYAVLTKKQMSDDRTIRQILTGEVFNRLNIERFVEDDFFHWVASAAYFKRLHPMFRELNRQIAQYDFSEVKEDILKGLYQEMIDLETRHALGEYYTPDWLCERMVGELPLDKHSYILDPACGSGSFLRAALARFRQVFPDLPPDTLAAQVVGIDIHPLSVQIAKTTVLLALGEKVAKAKRPVTLHCYLANSLLVPRKTADLFETSFRIVVDNVAYTIDIRGIESPDHFDQLITFCDDMVQFDKRLDRDRFVKIAKRRLPSGTASSLPGQLFKIYQGMKGARDEGRDSIWTFILQNSYKPVFLRNRFDFVIGNPPWLTYAAISNGEYQLILRELSDGYNVTPRHRANMPHLEIAAIFLAHSVNYFLKPSGLLAFVLPRSFMTADQHDNTRAGSTKGQQLTRVWDLEAVHPLFRVPTCVMFAKRSGTSEGVGILPSGIPLEAPKRERAIAVSSHAGSDCCTIGN
jgi:SAM-dependent methyltransferase